jgi:hypothetical protein
MATLRQKIDFLLKSDGILESAILAKAIEVGVTQLYENAITEAYLAGTTFTGNRPRRIWRGKGGSVRLRHRKH